MARRKKRKLKVGRIIILIFLLGVLSASGYFAYQKFTGKRDVTKKVKEISNIKGYGYTLKENATDYYKKLFKKLGKVLSSDDVDVDKYAEIESQMFVADFFNLDNKVSKNDVGGVEFVYEPYKNDFKKYAMDSIYKSVTSNVYGNRKQLLPIVDDVKVSKVKNESFKYGDSSDDEAYVFNFSITYKDDLDYQDSGSLILIHSGKKLEVAAMSENEAS